MRHAAAAWNLQSAPSALRRARYLSVVARRPWISHDLLLFDSSSRLAICYYLLLRHRVLLSTTCVQTNRIEISSFSENKVWRAPHLEIPSRENGIYLPFCEKKNICVYSEWFKDRSACPAPGTRRPVPTLSYSGMDPRDISVRELQAR